MTQKVKNVVQPKVYHISPLRLCLGTSVFIVLGVILLLLAGDDTNDYESSDAFLFTGLWLFVCAAMMYLLLRYSRLELTPDRIRLFQFGYTLDTGWDNVAALYDRPGRQGLVLHVPMDCRGAYVLPYFRGTRLAPGLKMYNDEQMQLIAERRFIPIEAFAYWLEHGHLQDDLADFMAPIRRRDLQTDTATTRVPTY